MPAVVLLYVHLLSLLAIAGDLPFTTDSEGSVHRRGQSLFLVT